MSKRWAAEKFNVPLCDSSSLEIPGLLGGDGLVCSGVILLSAHDWNHLLPDSVARLETVIPELSEFFDCIVAILKGCPETT